MSGTLIAGGIFGDYRVVRRLGKGGMGEVWLLKSASGALVAAKILDPATAADHETRKRFLREAELALGVKHPNLVETYDVGEDPESGFCYILMEYVSGGTLADYLKTNGAMAIDDAVAVIEAMADVLELGRQKGIVHRDIKPANIMFASDGTPKLADLGIARGGGAGTETTTVTQTGMMIGTPAYMSPEQMLDAHNVDTRADIYSLGVVFFEMLTGERPNKGDTVIQLMAKAVKGEPLPDVRTLRPEVSAALAQLLNMMVVPNRDGRISTPGQITNALALIKRNGKIGAQIGRIFERSKIDAQTDRKRRREILVLILTGIATAVVLGAVLAVVFPLLVQEEDAPCETPPAAVDASGGKRVDRPSVAVKTPSPKRAEPKPAAPERVKPQPVTPEHVNLKSVLPDRVDPKPVDPKPVEPKSAAPKSDSVKDITITVHPSCAHLASVVTNWTAETIQELKRQMGTAFDESRENVMNELIVGTRDEAPTVGWIPIAAGLKESFAFTRPKRQSNLFVAEGWEGFPDESAHGHFVVYVAQVSNGFHYDLAQAEISPIAWGLKNALGLTVAQRLGYDAAAEKWLGHLRARAERVMKSRGVGMTDVTLEGKLREGAKPKNDKAGGDYVWIVEYRIARMFSDLMREQPDVMHDYFSVRNEYRRTHGGNVRITPAVFATLLGQVMQRDMVRELDKVGCDVKLKVDDSPSPASRKAVKEDRRVRIAKANGSEWCYTLEDDEAVIWRNYTGYSRNARPAVSPVPVGHVTIPSKLDGHPVRAIGATAFSQCGDMTSVKIPEGVVRIDDRAFYECKKLESVDVPESLRTVGDSAFGFCQSLKSIDLKNCTQFDGYSFWGCGQLERVSVRSDRTGFKVVDGGVYSEEGRRLVFWPRTSLAAIVPDGVVTIGCNAFERCSVRKLSLPKSVRKIEARAFAYCHGLSTAVLNEGLVEIGTAVFRSCDSLRSVFFPSTLKRMGSDTFFNSDDGKLEHIVFGGNAPAFRTSSYGSILGSVPSDLEIVVMKGTTGWKNEGSAELPERWPDEGSDDSRRIRAVSEKEMQRLLSEMKNLSSSIACDTSMFSCGVPMGAAIRMASSGTKTKSVAKLKARKVAANKAAVKRIEKAMETMAKAKMAMEATRAISEFESAVKAYHAKYVGNYGSWPLSKKELAKEEVGTEEAAIKAVESVLANVTDRRVSDVYEQKLAAMRDHVEKMRKKYSKMSSSE